MAVPVDPLQGTCWKEPWSDGLEGVPEPFAG